MPRDRLSFGVVVSEDEVRFTDFVEPEVPAWFKEFRSFPGKDSLTRILAVSWHWATISTENNPFLTALFQVSLPCQEPKVLRG